jgi:hypothetical protein
MTYEEKVHAFGLRWLLANPGTGAVRLASLDPARWITLYDETSGYGCSCDYDYDTEYGLVVPDANGQVYRVELTGMTFAEVLKAIVDEDGTGLEQRDAVIIGAQAAHIATLKADLQQAKLDLAKVSAELKALRSGLSQQTELWRFLRNLYRDLVDRVAKDPAALNEDELAQLIQYLYRELDLWFNSDIGTETGKATFKLQVSRSA